MKRTPIFLLALLVLAGCGGDSGGGVSKSLSLTSVETSVAVGATTEIRFTQKGYNAYAYSLSIVEPEGGTISPGSGDPPANGITRNYTAPATAGTYHVVGTVTDQNNRQVTATLAIEVTEAPSP